MVKTLQNPDVIATINSSRGHPRRIPRTSALQSGWRYAGSGTGSREM